MRVSPYIVLCLLVYVVTERATASSVVDRAANPVAHLTVLSDRLSRRVAGLKGGVNKLESRLAGQQSKLDDYASKLAENSKTVANLTSLLNQASSQMTQLSSFLNSHVSNFESRVSTIEHPVAFSMHYKDDSVVNTTDSKGPVVFDVVTLNVGGGNYSNTTGRYTAPSDGTYAFFMTIQRNDPTLNSCLQVVLFLKGRQWTDCVVSACPPGYSSASNMCVRYLRKGDTVHVQGSSNHQIFGFIHTTFSGFKLI